MSAPRPSATVPQGIQGTALFSGGLDSFAAVAQLTNDGVSPALLTHMANPAVSAAVGKLLGGLPSVPKPAPLPIVTRNGPKSGLITDESQRARSLLYIASAVLASKVFDVNDVWVGENGILSVHEPETEARVPSLSTRTAHPQVLEAIARLSADILGFDLKISNPLEHLTKAGVVELLDKLGHSALVPSAISCWKISRDPQHCGYCIPCLQRYVATAITGVPDNVYSHNPWQTAATGATAADEQDNLVHFLQLATRIEGASDLDLEFEHTGLFGIGGSLTDTERIELHRTWATEVLTVANSHPRSSGIL